MAYESFTLESLMEKFAVTYAQSRDDFGKIPVCEPSDWLKKTLEVQAPLVAGKTSEKARSELLVSPILIEVREIREQKIMVFSGIKFDVDKKAGLFGYCDFLVTKKPFVDIITAPVIVIAEAKKEDLNAGVPQCVAEMIAANLFNDSRKESVPVIYGTVTDGTRWRFLRLEKSTLTIDLREYTLAELPHILGILVYMAS
ncbi:MAG: hypothetical protein H8F28_18750 [Fibrella sp.]|nr:hypothetical protein [Armatimonadota bacterium]